MSKERYIMGIFKKVDKSSIITGAINLLETLKEESSFADKMKVEFRKEVMKDENVSFTIRSFKNKFGLQAYDMYVEPVISENKLTINKWQFIVNGKPLFATNGLDTLLSKITESILTNENDKVMEIVNELKPCLE